MSETINITGNNLSLSLFFKLSTTKVFRQKESRLSGYFKKFESFKSKFRAAF